MTRGKADFKARREALGLTQHDVAAAAGVTVTSVKRWERPGCPEPPADVWEWVEGLEAMQEAAVEQAVSAAVASAPPKGRVQITYYRSQEQYDALGRDEGPCGMANANARLAAWRLRALGYEVGFAYPDDAGNLYHNG